MLDVSQDLSQEDQFIIEHMGNRPIILLANKIDLGAKATMEELQRFLPKAKIIETSMVAEIGLEQIEDEIQNLVYQGKVSQQESLLVTNARVESLLRQANDELLQGIGMAQINEPLEFIEVNVRRCYELLGEIIGETVAEDIINEVFSRFCLGK